MARSKLSNVRYKAFIWLIIGIGFFYLAIIFKIAKAFAIIGGIAMAMSIFMYSRASDISTKAKQIECPSCQKQIKVVSRMDYCSKCKTKLIENSNGVYKPAKK